MLQIELLGTFRILADGRILDILTRPRSQSLLAYLLMSPDTVITRSDLASVFWPDSSSAQARTNLRREIHHLRRAHRVIDSSIVADTLTLYWKNTSAYSLDVSEFQQAIVALGKTKSAKLRKNSLDRIVRLYRGEFLQGISDTWAVQHREAMTNQFLLAAQDLASRFADDNQISRAIELARRILAIDPLSEPGCLQLMKLYARSDLFAQAIQTYHRFSATMQTELGITPNREVAGYYEEILAKTRSMPVSAGRKLSGIGPSFVGRHVESREILRLWQHVCSGQSRICLVEGEPGIGKTRLIEEVSKHICRQGAVRAGARAWIANGHFPFAPVVSWLQAADIQTRLSESDDQTARIIGLALPGSGVKAVVDTDGNGPAAPSGDQQRRQLFEAIAAVLSSRDRPTLLLLDDLQWCDQDTLECIHFLVRFDPSRPLLVMCSLRPEEVLVDHPLKTMISQLGSQGVLSRISLDGLNPKETETLLSNELARAGHSDMAPRNMDAYYGKYGGNPLFAVEWVRTLRAEENDESAAFETQRSHLPPLIDAVINTRIAILPKILKTILGLASVFGRGFSVNLLGRASGIDNDDITDAIDDLWRRRLIRDRDDELYEFEHDCIRETAYESLGPAKRQQLHHRAATALVAHHDHDPDSVASQVAYHFKLAGESESAIEWFLRTAEASEKIFAFREAIDALEQAIALCEHSGNSPLSTDRRVRLLLGVMNNLSFVEGMSTPSMARNIARLRLILPGIENPILKIQALNHVRLYDLSHDLPRCLETARRVVTLTEKVDIPIFGIEAHRALSVAQLFLGQFVSAERSAAQAVGIYDLAVTNKRADPGEPPWPLLNAYAAWSHILWILGRNAAAQRCYSLLDRLPVEHISIGNQVPILALQAEILANWRQSRALRGVTTRMSQFSDPRDHPLAFGLATYYRGHLSVAENCLADGIKQFCSALEVLGDNGVGPLYRTRCLAALADAQVQCDRASDALETIETAWDIASSTSEDYLSAEFHRLKAQALACCDASMKEVNASFECAKETAQRQFAKTFLARALASQGQFLLERGDVAASVALLPTLAESASMPLAVTEKTALESLIEQIKQLA